MTREEIINRFRQENPEITDRVITDTVLNSWCLVGDKEICTRNRLLKSEGTFTSVSGTRQYDLTQEISNFYDIDDLPGGGVIYANDPLTYTTIAELDQTRPNWRSESNGTPKYYYRRNQYLYFNKAPSSGTTGTVRVYVILISDDFDDDSKLPFNQLTFLEPFHYSLVLYLTMRAKGKVGKPQEKQVSMQEYNDYLRWMKREVDRGTFHTIQFKPQKGYRSSAYSRSSRR